MDRTQARQCPSAGPRLIQIGAARPRQVWGAISHLVLARLERVVVLLLQDLLHLLARVLPSRRVGLVGDNVGSHNRLELDLERVTRGHQVGVVAHLDERLHL